MPEVIRLEYSPTGGIVAAVDAVRELPDGTFAPIAGPPPPTTHFTLAELAEIDSQLTEDLVAVIARLEPHVRAKVDAFVETPSRLVEKAAAVATGAMRLEESKEQLLTLEALGAAAEAENARIALEIAKQKQDALLIAETITLKQNEASAVEAALAAKAAELAALEAAIAAKKAAAADAAPNEPAG